MGPRSFRARGNGLTLRVLEWGAGERTVVLLHGFLDAAGTWDLCAPRIAATGRRVLAVDLRGFGESDRVSGGGYYHFPDYVADVARVLAEHAGGPVDLVGHSMGGTVATLFAGARPEAVRTLALLEGMGPPDHPPEAGPQRMRRWLEGLDGQAARKADRPMTEAEALARLRANHPRVPAEVLASRLPHLARATPEGLLWRFDPLHRTTAPVPFFTSVFTAYARQIPCPVLYVSGGPLGYRVPDEADRLAAFARATHVDLPGGGHMMHWTRPEELVRALVAFLDVA